MAKLFLFKTQEVAPEYVVRMKVGAEWKDVGTGTVKMTPKPTRYLEVDFVIPEASQPATEPELTSAGTSVPDWKPSTPEEAKKFKAQMEAYDREMEEKFKNM